MPFQCVLEYQPPLFLWSVNPSDSPAVDDWFCNSEQVCVYAHQWHKQMAQTQKINVDWHWGEILMSQVISLVSNQGLQTTKSKKLNLRYFGSYKILKQVNPITYKLDLPWNSSISHTFQVSPLKPVIPGPLATDLLSANPPTPLDIDG